jgi:tyrosyl-tRNA synthetase
MNYMESVESNLEAISHFNSSDFEGRVSNNLLERRSLNLAEDLDPYYQFDMIRSRATTLLPEEDLKTRMAESVSSGDPLVVKFGIDPTGKKIHLGHAVPIVLLERFRRMGHKALLIIGDMTAQIGDPSGRNKERPDLEKHVIEDNLDDYVEQIRPIMQFDPLETRKNSDWLTSYDIGKLTVLLGQIRISEILQRNDFRQRLEEGHGLSVAEILYPVIMGIDSVEVEADVEIGGKDQLLNLQMCRKIMEISGLMPEAIVTTEILEGTGQGSGKMSKSLGNFIAISDSAKNIFGGLMSVPDPKVESYLKSLTEITDEEWHIIEELVNIGKIKPIALKKIMALTVTGMLKGHDLAVEAHDDFQSQYGRSKNFSQISPVTLKFDDTNPVIDTLCSTTEQSKSALRRLAEAGAISLVSSGGEIIHKLSIEDLLNPLSQIKYDFPEESVYIKFGRREIFKVEV